ncbi:MAG: hypothetical protein ACOX62_06795 [Christensenellales bacterium]|jgi:hypothetical protein
MTIRKILPLILSLLLLMGFASAQEAAYAPDNDQWGTQNNNNWSYLYLTTDGEYKEMDFYTESDIGWQVNAFASDPFAMGEMFFISNASFFVGENGTRPVYAFSVPQDGRVELSFLTHGTEDMTLTVYHNNTLLPVQGQDETVFNTTGMDAGFTPHAVRLDVTAGDMLYLVGGTKGGNREGWVRKYVVQYLPADASLEVEIAESGEVLVSAQTAPALENHHILKPDFDVWGTQGNGSWHFLYKNKDGEYLPMEYREASDIGWQVNNFASDPNAMGEMFFISQASCFTGELGSLPVYAFEAPVGGDVELSFLTHGTADMHMRVLVNGNEQMDVALNTEGEIEGFTQHLLSLTVKKGTWIYLEVYTTGAVREAWIKQYQVRYLGYNDEMEANLEGIAFVPDHTGDMWGARNNNGWSYQYLDKPENKFKNLAFVRADDRFKGTADAGYEYLMIMRHAVHPALNGSPAMVFTAPKDGALTLYLMAKIGAHDLSPTSTGVAVYHNKQRIWPADEDFYKLGAPVLNLFLPIEVKANDEVAVVVDALQNNINYDETALRVNVQFNE